MAYFICYFEKICGHSILRSNLLTQSFWQYPRMSKIIVRITSWSFTKFVSRAGAVLAALPREVPRVCGALLPSWLTDLGPRELGKMSGKSSPSKFRRGGERQLRHQSVRVKLQRWHRLRGFRDQSDSPQHQHEHRVWVSGTLFKWWESPV